MVIVLGCGAGLAPCLPATGQPAHAMGRRVGAHEYYRVHGVDRGVAITLLRPRKLAIMSTPVENLTDPPVENLTDRRGDEPQVVVASCRAGVRRPRSTQRCMRPGPEPASTSDVAIALLKKAARPAALAVNPEG